MYQAFTEAYDLHPYLTPKVFWDGMFALHNAQRVTYVPVDTYDLAIQRVAFYKREQEK